MPPEKLLSCPFCGSDAVLTNGSNYERCCCSNAQCHANSYSFQPQEWNTRTPSPELVELRRDKERLDWIAEQESISVHMERDDFVWEISNKTTSLSEHPDLREAIDAAKEKK